MPLAFHYCQKQLKKEHIHRQTDRQTDRHSAENKDLRPLIKSDDLIKFPLAWIMF